MTEPRMRILVIAGGALIALGSILPWASVASGFGSASVNGIEGDGVITLGLGVGVALVAFFMDDRRATLRILFLVVAALAGFIFWSDMTAMQARIAEADSESVRISVGVGFYVGLLGVLVLVLGAALPTARSRRPHSALA